MGFELEVYKRAMPEGALSMDAEQCNEKYELHMNGKAFAAGMETIPEVINEISATFRERVRESDEITVASPESTNPELVSLTCKERLEFMRRAPLLSYAIGFLPN